MSKLQTIISILVFTFVAIIHNRGENQFPSAKFVHSSYLGGCGLVVRGLAGAIHSGPKIEVPLQSNNSNKKIQENKIEQLSLSN